MRSAVYVLVLLACTIGLASSYVGIGAGILSRGQAIDV